MTRATATLVAELAILKVQYCRALSASGCQKILDGRDRCAAAVSLGAVLAFLDRHPELAEADLGFALRKLLVGLNDLDNGSAVPWLSNQAPNRPPTTALTLSLRGRCAGLMEVLMTVGRSKQEAAQFIIAKAPALIDAIAPSRGDSPRRWGTLAEWHKRARGSKGTPDERESYRAMLAIERGGLAPTAFVERALVGLTHSAKGI